MQHVCDFERCRRVVLCVLVCMWVFRCFAVILGMLFFITHTKLLLFSRQSFMDYDACVCVCDVFLEPSSMHAFCPTCFVHLILLTFAWSAYWDDLWQQYSSCGWHQRCFADNCQCFSRSYSCCHQLYIILFCSVISCLWVSDESPNELSVHAYRVVFLSLSMPERSFNSSIFRIQTSIYGTYSPF